MRLFILSICMLTTPRMYSQELQSYQWKNRVLLLLADSFENNSLKKQHQLLSGYSKEIQDRKLMVFEVFPEKYRILYKSNPLESKTSTLFLTYNPDKKPYKIILLGLDGTVKTEKQNPVEPKEIFQLIDQMPIRKSELED